ncbi:vWA domain-containing protein [Catenuloplanes japonicus]|uniref:vWA domain-containing protein n=1 Tax=Catenuloplanes japonicus TaxID=33876 RepID=UPI000525EC7F|nr:VWA domain-containing protein [Catenuloplanes japonicus]
MSGNRFRYGAWRDGPDPLAAPFDVRAAVDQVGAEILEGRNLRDALRDLLRRGPRGERGLDDLSARARRMRREAMRRGNLDGAVTRSQALLDQALATEKAALDGSDDPDAIFKHAQLDNLPRSTARAVEELSDYRWTSAEAQQLYQQILDGLRNEVLDQRFAGMKQALQNDPEAAARMAAMMADLNALLARHARGEDTTDQFAEFMRRHGEMFPENPQTVDELIDALARRAAAGERLMRSLSPSQRAELESLMAQAFGDSGLAEQMSALTDNLRTLRPNLNWGGRERVQGRGELGYGDAAGALEEIGDLDDLIDQLGQDHPGATLDDVDVEAVERQLGRSAADDVRRLRDLERELRRQGWVQRGQDGLTLSPKALRRLGGTALRQVFAHMADGRRGQHDLRSAGAAGELTGASRPWEFGDEQPLDVVRTLGNAIRRSGAAALPIRLQPDDFEVAETERRATAAVAVLVDLSYSMFADGRWGPMKQTALALSHLVATKFPQDALEIIGFNRYAVKLSQQELAEIEPTRLQGTNLQHALMLAGRHLRKHPNAEPVVLVITDGEPTAHLDADGEAWFDWPTTMETLRATLTEVDHLTRYGATLNTFMLGEDEGLRRFVEGLARRNGGRVFAPDAADLGSYVVSDYIRARRGRRGGLAA